MSDPVTNVEIEDVLSSIRRLISEDSRPKSAPRAVHPEPQTDRLVLTPAQRVPDDGALPPEPGSAAPDSEPVLLTDPTNVPEKPASEEDGVNADEWETMESDFGERLTGGDARARAEQAPDDEPDVETLKAGAETLLGRLVEDELARMFTTEIEDSEEQVEQTDAEEPVDLMSATEEPEAPKQAGPTVAPETASRERPTKDVASSLADLPDGGLARKIAELEAMIARSPGNYESDTPGQGGNAAFVHQPVAPLDWEDHEPSVEQDADASNETVVSVLSGVAERDAGRSNDESAGSGASAAGAGDTGLMNGAEQLIDEEMLRDMVAEIVRQELQGTLGERITRNVRKLVRREIHRILMSQEFD